MPVFLALSIFFNRAGILIAEVMVTGYRSSGVGFQRWGIGVGFKGGEKVLNRERT